MRLSKTHLAIAKTLHADITAPARMLARRKPYPDTYDEALARERDALSLARYLA